MSHKTTAVTGMEYQPQRFRKVVWRVPDACWDVNELDTTPLFPILDRKILNVDMSSTFSRDRRVDNINSRCIVFVDRSSFFTSKAEFI